MVVMRYGERCLARISPRGTRCCRILINLRSVDDSLIASSSSCYEWSYILLSPTTTTERKTWRLTKLSYCRAKRRFPRNGVSSLVNVHVVPFYIGDRAFSHLRARFSSMIFPMVWLLDAFRSLRVRRSTLHAALDATMKMMWWEKLSLKC